MKRLISFLLLLVSIHCIAQDEVFFHNGTIARGKVSEVTDLFIKFCYEGEDVQNIIGRAAISEVRFSSGRVQQMSQVARTGREAFIWHLVILYYCWTL